MGVWELKRLLKKGDTTAFQWFPKEEKKHKVENKTSVGVQRAIQMIKSRNLQHFEETDDSFKLLR